MWVGGYLYYTVINYKGTVDTSISEKLSRLCFVRGRKYYSEGMGHLFEQQYIPTGLLVRVVNVGTILSDVPPNIF